MKKISYYLQAIVLILIISTGCKKFVDIGSPKDQIVTSQVFADSLSANSALAGLYVSMMQSFSLNIPSGGMTFYPGLSADELTLTATNATYNQFLINNIANNNSANSYLWTSGYKFIYQANACIEGITASTGISAAAKDQQIAEARFWRAFLYFYLTNLYGDVPLVTTTDYSVTRLAGRTANAAILSAAEDDLLFAEAKISPTATVNNRATSLSASALLARVYLYESKYDLAQAEATKVISSGSFLLEPDLNNVFLTGSRETILRLSPVYPGKETWEGYTFIPSSTKVVPKYSITTTLYTAFETGDQRKAKWINANVVSGKTYPYPYKYKKASTTGVSDEDNVVLRLAEMYLIRAEAEINQGNFSAAIADLNVIRNRAGLPATTASDKQTLLNALLNERRFEFFCEWGHRWFDLKRMNLAIAVLSGSKPAITSSALLYPVPLTELTNNPALTQNPGY